MFNLETLPQLSQAANPPVGYYFMVVFFIGGTVPNPIDIRFQKVSGLSATIETEDIAEGGENLFKHRLPKRVTYNNLQLERGLMLNSPLSLEFNTAMSLMQFSPGNVLVILLNEKDTPAASWLFENAYPVAWLISDLNANQNAVVIDTMELAYSRYRNLRS